MKFLFVLLFSLNTYALICAHNEVYIREQKISAYEKSDGTSIKAHIRKAHCRRIQKLNYFKDATSQKIKGLKTTIKKMETRGKERFREIFRKTAIMA